MSLDFSGAVAFFDDREDVLVIDVSDEQQRALAEEQVPHIILTTGDGLRHKVTPDRQRTACGEEYRLGFDLFVPETLVDNTLCPHCFTPWERGERVRIDTEKMRALEKRPTTTEWLDEQESLAAEREAKRQAERANPKRKK